MTYLLTLPPWTLSEAIHRAKCTAQKDDTSQVIIIDLDYTDYPNRPYYYDYCTWNDFHNQQLDPRIALMEIDEHGHIIEDYR